MDHMPCDKCGKHFAVDFLDANPRMDWKLFLIWLLDGQSRMLSYAGDHGYDFTRFECRACYGLEYVSLKATP